MAGVGGKTPGAGRPKGSKNRRTVELIETVKKSGMTPLEWMLSVLHDKKADKSRRDDMAKAAAPYVHPRLLATEHTGSGGGPVQHKISVEFVGTRIKGE